MSTVILESSWPRGNTLTSDDSGRVQLPDEALSSFTQDTILEMCNN